MGILSFCLPKNKKGGKDIKVHGRYRTSHWKLSMWRPCTVWCCQFPDKRSACAFVGSHLLLQLFSWRLPTFPSVWSYHLSWLMQNAICCCCSKPNQPTEWFNLLFVSINSFFPRPRCICQKCSSSGSIKILYNLFSFTHLIFLSYPGVPSLQKFYSCTLRFPWATQVNWKVLWPRSRSGSFPPVVAFTSMKFK